MNRWLGVVFMGQNLIILKRWRQCYGVLVWVRWNPQSGGSRSAGDQGNCGLEVRGGAPVDRLSHGSPS